MTSTAAGRHGGGSAASLQQLLWWVWGTRTCIERTASRRTSAWISALCVTKTVRVGVAGGGCARPLALPSPAAPEAAAAVQNRWQHGHIRHQHTTESRRRVMCDRQAAAAAGRVGSRLRHGSAPATAALLLRDASTTMESTTTSLHAVPAEPRSSSRDVAAAGGCVTHSVPHATDPSSPQRTRYELHARSSRSEDAGSALGRARSLGYSVTRV